MEGVPSVTGPLPFLDNTPLWTVKGVADLISKRRNVPAMALATAGMIDAYNAGLSIRNIHHLWRLRGILSPGSIHQRLKNSGVATRPRGGGWPEASRRTIARFRSIAEAERPKLIRELEHARRVYPTPGQLAAYRAGLSFGDLGELWGMSRAGVHKRFKQADVETRPLPAKTAPSVTVVAYYRRVANQELAAAQETAKLERRSAPKYQPKAGSAT